MIDFPTCFFEEALYSITELTDITLAAVPFARLFGLFAKEGSKPEDVVAKLRQIDVLTSQSQSAAHRQAARPAMGWPSN